MLFIPRLLHSLSLGGERGVGADVDDSYGEQLYGGSRRNGPRECLVSVLLHAREVIIPKPQRGCL